MLKLKYKSVEKNNLQEIVIEIYKDFINTKLFEADKLEYTLCDQVIEDFDVMVKNGDIYLINPENTIKLVALFPELLLLKKNIVDTINDNVSSSRKWFMLNENIQPQENNIDYLVPATTIKNTKSEYEKCLKNRNYGKSVQYDEEIHPEKSTDSVRNLFEKTTDRKVPKSSRQYKSIDEESIYIPSPYRKNEKIFDDTRITHTHTHTHTDTNTEFITQMEKRQYNNPITADADVTPIVNMTNEIESAVTLDEINKIKAEYKKESYNYEQARRASIYESGDQKIVDYASKKYSFIIMNNDIESGKITEDDIPNEFVRYYFIFTLMCKSSKINLHGSDSIVNEYTTFSELLMTLDD
jgi:hypothetical protein